MKPTTLEMFRGELLRTGGYITAPGRRAPKLRRPGPWTTFRFSWDVFSVFPKCGFWETLGRLDTDLWARVCFKTLRTAERFGMTVSAEGWENRRDHKGPVVYVANHMSSLETIMLPFILLAFGPFNTVVKASLAHIPGSVNAARHMGLVPIGRTNPREDLMTIFKVGAERIGRGESFLIFAQGTRQPVFARRGWSSIGAKLAERCGVPVVPIALKTDCLPTRPEGRGLFRDFGAFDPAKDIRFACGPVLRGTARGMHQASFDWIRGRLDAWGLPTAEA